MKKNEMKAWVGGAIIGAAAVILIALPAEAHAHPKHYDTFDVNVSSFHADTSYKYNDLNVGFGYSKKFDHHWGITGGGYQNSYDKTSLYLMGTLEHRQKDWSFGMKVGFVTGYDNVQGGVNTEEQRNSTSHHEREDEHYDKRYKVKGTPHSHPVNKNEFTFAALPTITWHVTKKHAMTLGFTNTFATLQYNYTLGGK